MSTTTTSCHLSTHLRRSKFTPSSPSYTLILTRYFITYMDRISTLDLMIQRCLVFLTTSMNMTICELQESAKNGNLSFLDFAVAKLHCHIEARTFPSDSESWKNDRNLIKDKLFELLKTIIENTLDDAILMQHVKEILSNPKSSMTRGYTIYNCKDMLMLM